MWYIQIMRRSKGFLHRNLIWGIIIFLILAVGGVAWFKYNSTHLNPKSSETYYKIFDKNEILAGNEDSAAVVVQKLDKRLAKYHSTFVKMAGTSDEYKLRALFMMNFVHMFGFYGKRELKENTFKEVLWGSEYFHCGTNTLFLAMLLDRAGGYEFRTISTNNGSHGFVEIKFDGHWQILDPTINVWINKSAEELMAGQPRETKKFFLKAGDQLNEKAQEDVVRVINVKDFMLKLGQGYTAKIDKYNYINLADYQY